MKIGIKYLLIGFLLVTPTLFPVINDEIIIDEGLISPAYSALAAGKKKSLQNVIKKLQITIKNLYARYEEGGYSDEGLKSTISQLTSRYLALKKMNQATL